MTGIVWFCAMARRFAAASDCGSNRTGPKITQAEEFLQELGSIGLQGRERVWQGGSFLSEPIRSELWHKKGESNRCHSCVAHPGVAFRYSLDRHRAIIADWSKTVL